jgi:hypothetical protein
VALLCFTSPSDLSGELVAFFVDDCHILNNHVTLTDSDDRGKEQGKIFTMPIKIILSNLSSRNSKTNFLSISREIISMICNITPMARFKSWTLQPLIVSYFNSNE